MDLSSASLAPLLQPLIDSGFAEALTLWYRKNRRKLPWREKQNDPYAVWVSEIMLQQTTVAAVIPYYDRWMSEFPSIESLASADLQDVLWLWSGLGYYARARNLKKSAEIIALDHFGRMPQTVRELLKLPGIGRYTAGAIASIALGGRAPILDGNIMRALTRLLAIDNDIDSSQTVKALWEISEKLLPRENCGEYNQAIMELGATVCAPGAPKCHLCPVPRFCIGYRNSEAALYPRRAKKTRWENVTDCSLVLIRENALAMIRRPENGVWGGLWETPRATCEPEETFYECARRIARRIFGGEIEISGTVGPVKHVVMNRKIELYGVCAELLDNCGEPEDEASFRWIELDEIENYPLSAPQKSLLQRIGGSASGF